MAGSSKEMKAALEQHVLTIYDEADGQTELFWLNGTPVLKRSRIEKGQGKGKPSSWDTQSWDWNTSREDGWTRPNWESPPGDYDYDIESRHT